MSRNYTPAQKAENTEAPDGTDTKTRSYDVWRTTEDDGANHFYSPSLPGKGGKLRRTVSGREKRYFPFGAGFPALEAETRRCQDYQLSENAGRCGEFLRPDPKRYLYRVQEQRDDATGTGILSGKLPGGEICMKIEYQEGRAESRLKSLVSHK